MAYTSISILVSIILTVTIQARQEESFSFIVLADWHGAESFATKGASGKGYQEHLKNIQHIRHTYGGELVIFPGDTNTGKWTERSFTESFDPSLTANQVVLRAGRKCYRTVKKLFKEGGYDKILTGMVSI